MLKDAKNVCDYLIVGLQVDPSVDRPNKNKPIQSLVERYIQIQAVKYVDEIIPYETESDLYDLLELLVFDVRIIGEEYREKEFTGKDICEKKKIRIFYNNRDHKFSSTELRYRVTDEKN